MTFTEEQVERIVVEVIRRLGLLGASHQTTVTERSTTTKDLVIPGKVITLALLDRRLAGANRLVVEQRAVITPAVIDELKQRKIELVRQTKP